MIQPPSQVIECIKSIGSLEDSATAQGQPTSVHAVLLVTKGLTGWLYDEDSFLKPAVQKLMSGRMGELPTSFKDRIYNADVLVAVVDRLPAPNRTLGEAGQVDVPNWMDSVKKSQQSPPFHDVGTEGIAYCCSRTQRLVANLWRPLAETPISTSLSDKYQATISFSLCDAQTNSSSQYPATTITVPLATTIFANGNPSTMFASRWLKRAGAETVAQVRTLNHQHQVVSLPTGKLVFGPTQTVPSGAMKFTFAMPLIPITQTREIKSCRGNIIRTLLRPDQKNAGADEELTASQELEAVVANFFKSRNLPPQAIDAWALVIPKSLLAQDPEILHQLDSTGVSQQERLDVWHKEKRELWEASPFPAVWRGARMHRVLSGGGGWGQKAGLISLDPDSTYGGIPEETIPILNKTTDEVKEPTDSVFDSLDFMFASAVSPGDLVKFYLLPPLDTETYATKNNDEGAFANTRRHSLDFGVVPSFADMVVLENEVPAMTDSNDHPIQVFHNHFGVLSETGLTIRQNPSEALTSVQTKIDVPFSRLSYSRG